MRELYEKIKKGTDRRASLIALKKELKDEAKKKVFLTMTGNRLDEIMKCLVDEDPKVRKNAAAILGELHCQDALDVLMDAYEEEDKLFVRESYVQALSAIDCSEYLPQLEERLQELAEYDAPEEEKKHTQAELHALQELILQKKGVKKHTFNGWNRSSEVLLLTLPAFRDLLAEQVTGKKKILKSGVRTIVSDFEDTMKIRTFRNCFLSFIHRQRNMSCLLNRKPWQRSWQVRICCRSLQRHIREKHRSIFGSVCPAEWLLRSGAVFPDRQQQPLRRLLHES